MASTTIGINCGHCGAELGELPHVGDSLGHELFQAHEPVCPVLQEIP